MVSHNHGRVAVISRIYSPYPNPTTATATKCISLCMGWFGFLCFVLFFLTIFCVVVVVATFRQYSYIDYGFIFGRMSTMANALDFFVYLTTYPLPLSRAWMDNAEADVVVGFVFFN